MALWPFGKKDSERKDGAGRTAEVESAVESAGPLSLFERMAVAG